MPGETKTARLMVRFTQEERIKLDVMAENLGLSTATFVRSLVIQHMKRKEKECKS